MKPNCFTYHNSCHRNSQGNHGQVTLTLTLTTVNYTIHAQALALSLQDYSSSQVTYLNSWPFELSSPIIFSSSLA